MNRNKLSYSRHLVAPETSLQVSEVGSVGRDLAHPPSSQNIKLISLLDEEQLRTVPSTEEIWSRRKSLQQSLDDDEGICPCLARIFREQLEEMRRILPARGSVDLSHVSQIDSEQTVLARRSSLPSRYVSVLDNEQRPKHVNYEVVLKAYLKMKKTKCKCSTNPRQGTEDVDIPEVNVIPSTPLVSELHLGAEVEEVLPEVSTDITTTSLAKSGRVTNKVRKRLQTLYN